MGRYRRLSKDYEKLILTSEAMVKLSMIHLMVKRLEPGKGKQKFSYPKNQEKAA